MHSRVVRTVLTVLTTVGLLASAAVSSTPSTGHSVTSAPGHLNVQPSGVFGWD